MGIFGAIFLKTGAPHPHNPQINCQRETAAQKVFLAHCIVKSLDWRSEGDRKSWLPGF